MARCGLIGGVACAVDLNMVPEAISKMLEPMKLQTQWSFSRVGGDCAVSTDIAAGFGVVDAGDWLHPAFQLGTTLPHILFSLGGKYTPEQNTI